MNKGAQVKESGQLSWKVNRAVVSHLSLGLYRNFARAVKELVSNSYDAGATEVKIKLDLNKNEIIVRDNGCGMDKEEIEKRFLTIGYVTPQSLEPDELGRKRIGTFGIGCLSVFPYCHTVQVITKKKDKDQIIELTINTEKFFEGVPSDIEKEKVPFKLFKSDLPQKDGETIITLKGIRPHIVKELSQKNLLKKKRGWSSIDKFTGFEKFKWTLRQYVSIQFPSEFRELRNFFNEPGRTPMRVWLDGEELFRNVPNGAEVLEKAQETFGSVQVKYVIMTSMKPVEPEEARGLQVRLRDVAVGLPTDFEVTKFTGKVPGKLNYLSGEVQVLNGLDSALMIDRDSFSYTQEVANMQDFFRRKLTKWNDQLERWAVSDKAMYQSLMTLKTQEPILDGLKKAGLVHFPKERLRIPSSSMTKRKKGALKSPLDAVKEILNEKPDYKVVSKKGHFSQETPPIEIRPREKSIIIYEDHPELLETIQINNQSFNVAYDKWDYKKTPYAICKLAHSQKTVMFNVAHPVFKSKLSERIIKKLALGILLIVKGRKDDEKLIGRVNQLLEDVLQG